MSDIFEMRDKEWCEALLAEKAKKIVELQAEIERLRAALESVMVGGNSLAQIIGADHPPHGTPYGEALAHYGSGVKYEAWCCWNAIMQARAALEEGRSCTCHPSEAPTPCQRKYALGDCIKSALEGK